MPKTAYRTLAPGDPAPWFRQRNTSNPDYAFDTAAGRYLVLCFFGSASDAECGSRLTLAAELRHLFDDEHLSFFGVSVDPADESAGKVRESMPGIRYFWDIDRHVSRLYGAAPAAAAGTESYRARWVVLNPNLQVRAVLPFEADRSDLAKMAELLQQLPPINRYGGCEMHAPVILLTDIFDPEFCRVLIAQYHQQGGAQSGFMLEKAGITVGIQDTRHKVRRDVLIQNDTLRQQVRARIERTVIPAIEHVHCFTATRMERYLVGCYDSAEGGHFRPHRDNTTRGTAHRRFALSINLNDDFHGGELRFPEFGSRGYKPPVGGGVVFSCSLLHTVTPIQQGRRYAFLPFLYDEKAAALREENRPFLAQENAAAALTAHSV